MVTNPTYKNYSIQIAKHFCKDDQNKLICEASISNRLNTFLDDYTYPIFLSKLVSGRQYITGLEAFKDYGFRIVITDLITGVRETAWWEIPFKYPYLGKLPGKLLQHQYNIISANKTFSDENKEDLRITHNPIKQSYGVTFIPAQPPGYVPPGGGGSYVPPGGGGNIIPTPLPPSNVPNVPAASGFDIKSLLENPMVLIGIGVAAYFLLIKK